MKTFSFILLGMCAISSLKAQKSYQLSHSAGINYAESYGQYANSSALNVVYAPGLHVPKTWGNWRIYAPLSVGWNMADGRSATPVLFTAPVYLEIGFSPGKPNLNVHGGVGYSMIFNGKAFTEGQAIMGLYELHCGVQFKRFDTRLTVGTTKWGDYTYSRVGWGLYYYLNK